MALVRALPWAREELVDAAAYLDDQRPGLGRQLLDEYQAMVEFMQEQPAAGTPTELDARYTVRRYQMTRFRYGIFVAQVHDELVVIAVSHHKRAPRYWARRLDGL